MLASAFALPGLENALGFPRLCNPAGEQCIDSRTQIRATVLGVAQENHFDPVAGFQVRDLVQPPVVAERTQPLGLIAIAKRVARQRLTAVLAPRDADDSELIQHGREP